MCISKLIHYIITKCMCRILRSYQYENYRECLYSFKHFPSITAEYSPSIKTTCAECCIILNIVWKLSILYLRKPSYQMSVNMSWKWKWLCMISRDWLSGLYHVIYRPALIQSRMDCNHIYTDYCSLLDNEFRDTPQTLPRFTSQVCIFIIDTIRSFSKRLEWNRNYYGISKSRHTKKIRLVSYL